MEHAETGDQGTHPPQADNGERTPSHTSIDDAIEREELVGDVDSLGNVTDMDDNDSGSMPGKRYNTRGVHKTRKWRETMRLAMEIVACTITLSQVCLVLTVLVTLLTLAQGTSVAVSDIERDDICFYPSRDIPLYPLHNKKTD